MLSAVESFGSASAAAAHPYAHHNPFAIAAAAAAAGSAAAAAAAVIPSHHHHHHHHHSHHQSIKSNATAALEHQFVLNHNSIYNNSGLPPTTLNNHISNPHLGSGGLYLPAPRPTLSLIPSSAATNTLPTALVLPPKCSSQEQPKSPRDRSPRSKTDTFQVQSSDGSCSGNMSSAEFVRPHPKQPRYSNTNNSNNQNNNNNNIVNTTNNNNVNNHPNNNNNNSNYSSNAIPLHLRPTKVAGNHLKSYNGLSNSNNNGVMQSDKNHCGSNTNHLSPTNPILNNNHNNSNNNALNKTASVPVSRAKYSTEQTGPVNLVTNNNTNSVNHNNTNCRTPPTSLALETTNPSSVSDGGDCNRKQMPSDIYAQKLPFAAQNLAASAYQYNYPHIYASSVLYGSPGLFTGHHPLGHPNALRPCPTYLTTGQHDAFSPYLHPTGVYQSSVAPNVPSQSNAGLLRTAPQVILNNSNLTGPANSSSPIERVCSFALGTAKEMPTTNGTYLNGKVNTSPAAPESVSGFKVPCGKEGSLKHRILTRPSQSDRDTSKRKSPITVSVVRSNSSSSVSNFTKGAYIELANGVLRRVEDMRTEDFIQSAEKSASHQLAESTVVKIGMTSSNVVITFSYDKNRSKADIDVSQEHPFFVYGQGWASCNPELTLRLFGLKCQRLQVGDICISLKSREQQSTPVSNSQQTSSSSTSTVTVASQQVPSQQFDKSEPLSLPQNLSRKLTSQPVECAVPTTTTTIASMGSNRLTSMGAPTYIPNAHAHAHIHAHSYDESNPANPTYENQISRHHKFYQPPLHLNHSYHRILAHADATMSSSRLPLPPPSLPPQSHSAPVQQSCPPPTQSSYYPTDSRHHPLNSPATQLDMSNDASQQPVDASLSRKRRWSAPESICDDDETECHPATAPRLS